MAIPSGKFYYTLNNKKYDLADECESDVVGNLKIFRGYKSDDNPFYIPDVPVDYKTSAPLMGLRTSDYKYQGEYIFFPAIGTLPKINGLNPSDISNGMNFFIIDGPKADDSNDEMLYHIIRKNNEFVCEYANGTVHSSVSSGFFYKNTLPTRIIIFIQAAGGGGGGYFPVPQGSYFSVGGGGGSGAAAWCVFDMSSKTTVSFYLGRAGKGGKGSNDGEAATDSRFWSTTGVPMLIRGGKGGSKYKTGGSGGEKSVETDVFKFNGGYSLAGMTGGNGGAATAGTPTVPTKGEDATGNIAVYGSLDYGVRSTHAGGGLAVTTYEGGGGGAASWLSDGGVGGTNNKTASDNFYGAGGGGGYRSSAIGDVQGGNGGRARAIVYLGYQQ